MHLTAQQLEAVRKGEALRLTAPEGGGDFIILRADVYERIKALADIEDFGPAQVGRLIDQTMREYDDADPLLESYQRHQEPS